MALIKLLAHQDEKLKKHMEWLKLRNATYLSPQIPNQMIDVIGKRLIQAQIVVRGQKCTDLYIHG